MRQKNKATKTPMTVLLAVALIIMIAYTLIMFTVIGWAILKSLQPVEDFVLQNSSISAFPKAFSFSNYVESFSIIEYKNTMLFGMFLNSIVYSAGCAAVAIIIPCIAGYLTAKIDVWFNKFITGAVYFSMFFTCYGQMPSMIETMNKLHLMDTWGGMFLMKASFLSNTYLLFNAAFKSLSKEYSEAAYIDGASNTTVMFGICFPLVKTTILVLFITMFITFWNDYQTPMIYLSSRPTASYGIFTFNNSTNSYQDYPVYKLAGFMLILLPTFIMFIILKDYMLGNLTEGGVKG